MPLVTCLPCIAALARSGAKGLLSKAERRCYATTAGSITSTPVRNPRWLSEQRTRLGKCIMFGLDKSQSQEAGNIAKVLGQDWRGLVAGAEGFLITPKAQNDSDDFSDTAWEEKVTWGAQDPMGHVNNVNYLSYVQSSRIWYFRRLTQLVSPEHRRAWADLMSPKGIGLILKNVSVDFLLPLQYPDRISVYHQLSSGDSLGSDLLLKSTILSHKHQRPTARGTESVVLYDYQHQKKADLPAWIEKILRIAIAQEEDSTRYWLAKRTEVETALHNLEALTIFSGKEEDMGSAKV